MVLIWAKKPTWGPCRTRMGLMPIFCPYGPYINMFAGTVFESMFKMKVFPRSDDCRSYISSEMDLNARLMDK